MLVRIWLLLLLAAPAARSDVFTPVIVYAFQPKTTVVPGTDGRQHLVYELTVANTRGAPGSITRVAVADAAPKGREITTFDATALPRRLRQLDSKPPATPAIEANGMRLVLLDLAFAAGDTVPARLVHHVDTTGLAKPGASTPTPVNFPSAGIAIDRDVAAIVPPLAGDGWVAFNGCCEPGGAHRATVLPVNGALHFAQRFAIDWMQLDAEGRFVHGDPSDVRSYTGYGRDVLAVADATVLETRNDLPDQVPGKHPDPTTLTLETVDGNHVVLYLGNGRYAMYAHLQGGSVAVAPGSRVSRGQVIGKVGNTGNTSAPHLHFQMMDGPSPLGSEGIPYVLERFTLAGRIEGDVDPSTAGLDFKRFRGAAPSPRERQFPLDMDIVDFGG